MRSLIALTASSRSLLSFADLLGQAIRDAACDAQSASMRKLVALGAGQRLAATGLVRAAAIASIRVGDSHSIVELLEAIVIDCLAS